MKPVNPAEVGRVVIRATNWVGDAVMSVPALREIRRLFARAHIAIIVRPWVRDVYAGADFADELIVYDKEGLHRGLTGLLGFAGRLRSHRFDMAILLQNAFEAALISWLAGVPRRTGYSRDARSLLLTDPCEVDPEVREQHQAYYYLGILAANGWIARTPWRDPGFVLSIRLDTREEDRQAARDLLARHGLGGCRQLVGINAGASYGGAKRWPLERFAAVADALADEPGIGVALFGSPSEADIARQVAARMRRTPAVLAGQTTLGQLMALISLCRLFITNDSGPMHLAAALDVPQIAIFGSTSEVATGPLGGKAQVIKHPVECSPCFLRECPIDLRCMTSVTVERVLEAARARLQD